MLDGHCGVVNVKDRDERFTEQPCQVAAVVPQGTRENGGWKASEWLDRGVGIAISPNGLMIFGADGP